LSKDSFNQKIYQYNLNKSEKLMLYVLVDLGANLQPVPATLNKLSDVTSMNRNTVNTVVSSLKELGLLTVVTGTGKASNTYQVHL